MKLMLFAVTCIVLAETRGVQARWPPKCHQLPDGTGRCITADGVEYKINQKVNWDAIEEHLAETVSSTPAQFSTQSTPANESVDPIEARTARNGTVHAQSVSTFQRSGHEPFESQPHLDSSLFASNISELDLPLANESSQQTSLTPTTPTTVAPSELAASDVSARRFESKPDIGKLKLSIPRATVTSAILISQRVASVTVATTDSVDVLSGETAAATENAPTSAPQTVNGSSEVSPRSWKDYDNVNTRSSSLAWCCCEELLTQKSTRLLLEERGVAGGVQLARPHGLSLRFCRARACGRVASVATCVQKYRNAAVTLEENQKRRHFVLVLEDGCECGLLPNATTLPPPTALQLKPTTSSLDSNHSPRDADSTVGNIADMISDSVVKLASVSRKMFSLVGISTSENDATALAEVLDETAGLIERAADQLLHLNSAVVNSSIQHKIPLPFSVVATRTITVVTCLQTDSSLQPVHTSEATVPDVPFSYSVSESPTSSRLSGVTDPESQSRTHSGALPGPLLTLSFGAPQTTVVDPHTLTKTSSSSEAFLPSTKTESLKVYDLKSETRSTLLPSSNAWLPQPSLDESTSHSHSEITGPTTLLPGQVTVVTRVTTFVVVNGTTIVYSPSDPSTTVSESGGVFSEIPQRLPLQPGISVDSTFYATSSAPPLYPSQFVPDEPTNKEPKTTETAVSGPITTTIDVTIPLTLPDLTPSTLDLGDPISASGSSANSTILPGAAWGLTQDFSSHKGETEGVSVSTAQPSGTLLPDDVLRNKTDVTTLPSGSSQSSANISDGSEITAQEDKVLDIAKSLVVLKEKMKACLVNETAETKTLLGLQNGDFLSQPLQQQALLMPIWREFATSNILNDLDEDSLSLCAHALNTSAPISRLPSDFARGIRSLPKVSGLLMAVMELSHCVNLKHSCNALVNEELKRRLAAAQLIGTILTESRRSQLNLLTLVDVFFVDSRNSSSLSPDVLQMSLLSKITLIKEFERALEWSKSKSEDADDLSVDSLGIVLAYSAKLRPLVADYAALCVTESTAVTTSSNVSRPSPTEPVSTETESISVETTSSSPPSTQLPATFVPFTKIFSDLPRYHPIRLSRDELEKLIFP